VGSVSQEGLALGIAAPTVAMRAESAGNGPAPACADAPPPAGSVTDRWAAWDAFVASTEDTGFMQSSWWADFRRANGWRHFAAVLKSGGAVCGGAVVLKRFYAPGQCFYYMADGPVLSGGDRARAQMFDAVMRQLDERRAGETDRVSHLRIEPRWRQMPSFIGGFRSAGASLQPRTTMYIDLRPSMDEILARMRPKGRYNVGVARRHGVSVVEDASPRGMEDFLAIYGETIRRHRLRGLRETYFARLMPLVVTPGHASIFFAEYRGLRLATAIVVYFGTRVTYFFGGSLAAHRNVMAPYLLHFAIMQHARARGHECYDLYGAAPEGESGHPWNDISVFKRKLGGCTVSFVPTLDYVYDPAAYDRHIAEATARERASADSGDGASGDADTGSALADRADADGAGK
jgi:lipid II:glycine glycyltransferase (peptidoglycan interpeptide bridge formation enzyme)